ncbi:MAG: adenylate/guanylate cyclase domain-containing protein [Saprospiraceae bacterium]|nr:adenylate/guanylate cyclase domain-containing protein [Saprospiraceae bacterium]
MWYKSVFDSILNLGHVTSDTIELKSQKTIMTIALLATISNLFVFSMLFYRIQRVEAAATLMVFAIVILINILLFRVHGNFRLFRNAYFTSFYFYMIIYHSVMGGFEGSVQYIYYGIPALTGIQIFYRKTREKTLWFILYAITAIVLYLLEPVISDGMVPLPHDIVLLTYVNNFILISGLIFISINYFTSIIQKERRKSDSLLRNILPEKVIDELNVRGTSLPILAKSASVIFIDFVNFSLITEKMSPQDLVFNLNQYFTQFDEIFKHHLVEKLKTIGDGYMAVGGVPTENNTHPIDVALSAMQIIEYINQLNQETEGAWNVRIGINTGPMVAGIIGKSKFAYDVWGDNVNLASRLETAGRPGKINVSQSFKDLAGEFFLFEDRGLVEIKHGEKIQMYFLVDIREELRSGHFEPNDRFYELYDKLAKA